MPGALDFSGARLIATLAGCLLAAGCSPSEPGTERGSDLPGFVGFLLANVISSEERPPAESAPTVEPTLATLEPGPVPAEEPTSCAVPYSGPVTIVTVRNGAALERAMADRSVPIAYSTEDTVIYEDGRVLTANVEGVGEHLNKVGWAQNPMPTKRTRRRRG